MVRGQLVIELDLGRDVLVETQLRRGESDEGRKLVATEEGGTQTRGQVGAISTRTDQAVQPALWQMRVGVLVGHRSQTTSDSL